MRIGELSSESLLFPSTPIYTSNNYFDGRVVSRQTFRKSGTKMELDDAIRQARILIVDDVSANVVLLKLILDRAGFANIASTTDSREALELFTTFQPDLILLDLLMPFVDGFQVMEQLKALIPPGAYFPILVLTADITNEAKYRALSLLAKDFLLKPLDSVEVVLRIRNLLETRLLHLRLQAHNQSLGDQVRQRTAALHQAMADLMTAQEVERRRLSMDLHDGPLQSLGVAIMALERATNRHHRQEYEMVEQELQALRMHLAETVAEVRGILGDLSLQTLTSRGLSYALQVFVERFSNVTEIAVTLRDEVQTRLPVRLELLMYRLAQESLANVRKHAGASNVQITLEIVDGDFVMTIHDDGVGFDVEVVLADHTHAAGEQFGLRSMGQRIQNAQGKLTIISSPAGNTSLEFRCPLDQDWD